MTPAALSKLFHKRSAEAQTLSVGGVLLSATLLVLTLDSTPNNQWTGALMNLLFATVPYYASLKAAAAAPDGQPDAGPQHASPAEHPAPLQTSPKWAATRVLLMTSFITSVFLVINVAFSALQTAIILAEVPQGRSVYLTTVLAGFLLFFTVLPALATGSCILGHRREPLSLAQCFLATGLSLGATMLLNTASDLMANNFTLITILSDVFATPAKQELPLHGRMLLVTLSLLMTTALACVLAVWVYAWARLGRRRFLRLAGCGVEH